MALTNQSARKWLDKGFLYPFTNRAPLQVVEWSGLRASIPFSGASANVALPSDCELMELSASQSCYIAFGIDNSIVATGTIGAVSRLFLAGVQVVPVPLNPNTSQPFTWIAAIQYTAGGILQIEKVA